MIGEKMKNILLAVFVLISSLTLFLPAQAEELTKSDEVETEFPQSINRCASEYKKIGENSKLIPNFFWIPLKDTEEDISSKLAGAIFTTVVNTLFNTVGLFIYYPIETYSNYRYKKYYLGMSDFISKIDSNNAAELKSKIISDITSRYKVSEEEMLMKLDELRNSGFFCEPHMNVRYSEKGSNTIKHYGGVYKFNVLVRQETPEIVENFYKDTSNFETYYKTVLTEGEFIDVFENLFKEKRKYNYF